MLMMKGKLFDSIICKSVELLKADDARKSKPKVFVERKQKIVFYGQSSREWIFANLKK